MPSLTTWLRRRVEVRGRVQGVGFRPFVARLALDLGLGGFVGNDAQGVFIEVEGPGRTLDRFIDRLRNELPPLAQIHALAVKEISVLACASEGKSAIEENVFRIVASTSGARQELAITPDSALCSNCAAELCDPSDGCYRYPFINCTNCGPRYSIIRAIPYDRPQTTMAAFVQCASCQGEYDDPKNRRYHAQPNACPRCGPRAWLVDGEGREIVSPTVEDASAAIDAAAQRLRQGEIVAIKGLGGFHLAVRADDDAAVARLRARKGREAKPLALLVRDVAHAEALVYLDDASRAALLTPAAPIVLASRRGGAVVCDVVAPGHDELGVVLPYTPLHVLLMRSTGSGGERSVPAHSHRDGADLEGPDVPDAAAPMPALVLTSGNASGEPLTWRNDDAVSRLGSIADALLVHDRPIERPIDDSVVRSLAMLSPGSSPKEASLRESFSSPSLLPDAASSWPIPVRRARGYVPDPVAFDPPAGRPILALGGDLKGAICLARGHQAVLGEHLGDLDNPAAFRNFIDAQDRLGRLLQISPEVIVCDRHPGYQSTAYAQRLARGGRDVTLSQSSVADVAPVREASPRELIEVQHHHAHAVSCMVDNGLPLVGPEARVVALCCDGTGYGDGGEIWGGEVLVCDATSYRHAAQLWPAPLLGGDAAARQCWRPLAGLFVETFGDTGHAATREAMRYLGEVSRSVVDPMALDIAAQRLAQRQTGFSRGVPRCSSLGRLFDAVASLTGICAENRYESEAAMRVEAAAARALREGKRIIPLGGEAVADALVVASEGRDVAAPRLILDSRVLIRDLASRVVKGETAGDLAAAFHEGISRLFAAAAVRVAEAEGLERVVLSGGSFVNRLFLTRVGALLSESGLRVYRHRLVPSGDGGLALGQAAIANAQLIARSGKLGA